RGGPGRARPSGRPARAPAPPTTAAPPPPPTPPPTTRGTRGRGAPGRHPIRIGIGLHYGEATLGNVGSARRFEHTVVGETVNLASRIENLTRELDIALLVSDTLAEAVRCEGGEAVLAGFRDLGSHAIRGYTERVRLWGMAAESLDAV